MKKSAICAAIVLVIIILMFQAYRFATAPKYDSIATKDIDPTADPIQIDLENAEPIPFKIGDVNASLVPKARYEMVGKVCSRNNYTHGWLKDVAPFDLCVMWGRLATENLSGKVKFWQDDMRFSQFYVMPGSPFDVGYVYSHFSNNHVICHDETLCKAVSRIDKGDIVRVTGYLIYMQGTYKGNEVNWNSSLSRNDTGNGACEIIYLSSLQAGNKVYGKPAE